MAKLKKGGLGKGLDALFVDNETSDSGEVTLRLSEIEPNRDQPRKEFSEESLSELADSIRLHGVIQPLLVRRLPSGNYQLVAGERRWRASRMAGLTEVPVVIRDLDDVEAMEIALIENLQRQDLNPIEEAMGYRQLMEKYGMTQEQVAQRVGKSRPAVANALRLLNLPQEVLEMVRDGQVTSGHARALLPLAEEPETVIEIARRIGTGRYSVRDVEKLCKARQEAAKQPKAEPVPEPAAWGAGSFYREVQLALEQELGRKVVVTAGKEGGTLSIQFVNEDDLRDLANKLSR